MSADNRLKRPVIIAVGNHKGGVGKTALAVHLATYLLDYVDKTLLIDMDSQGNASQWLFKDELDAVPLKVEDLLKDIIENGLYGREDEFKEMAKTAAVTFFYKENKTYDLICSTLALAPVRQIYSAKDDGNFLLQDSLRLLAKGYDVTIIDTPPGIDVSTIGTVAAADYLLIPVTPDPLAMHGARDTLSYVYTKAARHFNPFIKVLGLVITMVDKSSTARFGIDIVREAFGDYHVFESQIRTSARVRALPGKQKTLYQANPKSEQALAYAALAGEIYERIVADQADKHDKQELTSSPS